MLTGPLTFRRPHLRGEICTLIGLVNHGHVDGELHVPVEALVRMLGVSMSAQLHETLSRRGDLHFSGARFTNDGPPIDRQVRLMGTTMNFEMCPRLAGTITRDVGTFTLAFDPGASMSIGRFVFESELAAIHVDSDHLLVKFRVGPEVRIDLV